MDQIITEIEKSICTRSIPFFMLLNSTAAGNYDLTLNNYSWSEHLHISIMNKCDTSLATFSEISLSLCFL